MMSSLATACVLLLAFERIQVDAQRPHYAGQRPTGYHDRFNTIENTTTAAAAAAPAAAVPLDNRFGGSTGGATATTTTPTRVPTGALGDLALLDYYNQRPVEQRPFWLVNYEAIEAQKNGGAVVASRPTAAAAVAATATAASSPGSSAATTTALPELGNRIGGADQRPTSAPTAAATPPSPSSGAAQQQLGTPNDAFNYAIFQPPIVYPLPVVTPEDLAGAGIKGQPNVIMLNGQPFLLTPLVPDSSGVPATTPKV